MSSIHEVIEEAASRCLPDEHDTARMDRLKSSLIQMSLDIIQRMGLDFEIIPEVVGSAAKNTYLKGADIDLFLLFPPDVDEKITSDLCFSIGREILDEYTVKYASHPYLSGVLEGVGVDVVWAYKVRSGEYIISAVDRTPFHTRYVNDNLSKAQQREVRLLKKFLKGIDLYSASLKIEGISGYLTELLVIRFGTLSGTLEAISGWKKKTWQSLDGNTGENWELFPNCNLVFIDPVDRNRNVAAALTNNNFFRLIAACQEFLNAPSINFFYPGPIHEISLNELRDMWNVRGTSLLSFEIPRPDVVDDILYPQISKARTAIGNLLGKSGFEILGCHVNVGGEYEGRGKPEDTVEIITFVFEMDRLELPEAEIHSGPWVYLSNSRGFLRKWRNSPDSLSMPYIEEGRWKVIKKRPFRNAKEVIEANKQNIALGKDLDRMARNRYVIRTDTEVMTEKMERTIFRLFTKGEPWLR